MTRGAFTAQTVRLRFHKVKCGREHARFVRIQAVGLMLTKKIEDNGAMHAAGSNASTARANDKF
jgi:hypothetical protein